ncbi:hypothetical protein ERJ75_000473500 [Trypanosoma vivax]|nr:hypothetical protein ERJ75_000473500 [Trypanosoma vivax]
MAPALPRILCGSHATPQRAYALRAGPASAERSGLKRNTAHTPQSRASRNAHRSPPPRGAGDSECCTAAVWPPHTVLRQGAGRCTRVRQSRGHLAGRRGAEEWNPHHRARRNDTQGAATRRRGDRRTAHFSRAARPARCQAGAQHHRHFVHRERTTNTASPPTAMDLAKPDHRRCTLQAPGGAPREAHGDEVRRHERTERVTSHTRQHSAQRHHSGAAERKHRRGLLSRKGEAAQSRLASQRRRRRVRGGNRN